MVRVNGTRMENGAGWGWNGSMDKPTFTPSILVRSKEMTAKGWRDHESWTNKEIECPDQFDSIDTVCHSFVTDGKIQFLGDCTHKLAGQTVELPDWES